MRDAVTWTYKPGIQVTATVELFPLFTLCFKQDGATDSGTLTGVPLTIIALTDPPEHVLPELGRLRHRHATLFPSP